MDFPYLAKVAKLNIAALAAIASAPPPPEPKVEGAVSTDTTVTFRFAPDTAYAIHKRRTDANQWEPIRGSTACKVTGLENSDAANWVETCVLRHIRVDDWVFGVSSVSKDGFESPVASAVPSGAFKPYIAPSPEKK
jgi:hypothetical protein